VSGKQCRRASRAFSGTSASSGTRAAIIRLQSDNLINWVACPKARGAWWCSLYTHFAAIGACHPQSSLHGPLLREARPDCVQPIVQDGRLGAVRDRPEGRACCVSAMPGQRRERTSNTMSESSPTAPPLQVERLTKRFRQGNTTIEALKEISLTIEQGQFVAVMGASGSGKSTLLHVIAGLTRPDEGKVLVDGQDLSAMSDRRLTRFRRRHVGLVFQAFNLIPTLSAQDNVLLPILADRRGGRADDRFESLLARLGLDQRRRHRPDALSGGEQQRVAIARAIIGDPSIILADEPTGSLDSVTGQGICRLLQQLCTEQGRTIVVVTHEPAVAVWAERIIVLKDGRVLTEFPTEQFRDLHELAAHYQDVVGVAPEAEVHP